VVIWEALRDHSCILWMDSGIEARQSLSWAPTWLQDAGGLFIASGWPFPNSWVHSGTLQALRVSDATKEFRDHDNHVLKEVWSGIVGVNRANSRLMDRVIRPMYECALDLSCIAPLGSNKTNHRQDQTVLSILFLRDREISSTHRLFTTTKLRAFAPGSFSKLTAKETDSNDILVFQRRGAQPWPYHKHIKVMDSTSTTPD